MKELSYCFEGFLRAMTMPIAAIERPRAAMVAGSESIGPTVTFASAVFVPDPAVRVNL